MHQRLPLPRSPHAHLIAAALAACGYPVSVDACEAVSGKGHSERDWLAWWVDGNIPAASKLLTAWRSGTLPPGHPFLAAFFSVHTGAAVDAWKRGAGMPDFVRHGDLHCVRGAWHGGSIGSAAGARLINPQVQYIDRRPADLAPCYSVASIPHAVAALTAGFIPGTEFTSSGGLALSGRSATFPWLRISDLPAVGFDSLHQAVLTPPDGSLPVAPGEHPYCYALSAQGWLRVHARMSAAAASNRRLHIRGIGTRSAVVTNNLFSSSRYREAVARHLTGG